MYVAKLEISGVRGFDGPREVNLDFPQRPDGSYAGWTVLAGRNGSGKSSLLQAIILALAGPRNGGSLASSDDWSPDLDAVVGDVFPRWPFVKVGLVRATEHDPIDRKDAAWASVEWEIISDGPEPVWSIDRASRTSGEPDTKGPWSTRPDGWLYLGYGPFRRHSYPEVGLRGSDTSMRSAGFRTLFDEDATLVEGASWLIGQYLLQLERRPGAAELLETVLTLLGDGLLPDGHRISRVDSDGLWIRRPDGAEFPLRRMSDGHRTVGALVVDIIRRMHATYGTLEIEERDGVPALPYPGVVLIDEVDAHLHVSWQKKIGGG